MVEPSIIISFLQVLLGNTHSHKPTSASRGFSSFFAAVTLSNVLYCSILFFLRKACFESDFGAFIFAQGKIKTRQLGKRNEVRAFRFKFTHSTLATK